MFALPVFVLLVTSPLSMAKSQGLRVRYLFTTTITSNQCVPQKLSPAQSKTKCGGLEKCWLVDNLGAKVELSTGGVNFYRAGTDYSIECASKSDTRNGFNPNGEGKWINYVKWYEGTQVVDSDAVKHDDFDYPYLIGDVGSHKWRTWEQEVDTIFETCGHTEMVIAGFIYRDHKKCHEKKYNFECLSCPENREPELCDGETDKYRLFKPSKFKGKCELTCISSHEFTKRVVRDGYTCECQYEVEPGQDTCEVCQRPKYLEFQYSSQTCIGDGCNSMHKAEVVGSTQGETHVSWSVGKSDKCDDATFGSGFVSNGGSFTAIAIDKFDANIYLCLNDGEQRVKFRTSCDSPVSVGEQFGQLQLVAYQDETVPRDTTCGMFYTHP